MTRKDNKHPPSPAGKGEDGLTQKQRLFVVAYTREANATRAAIAAGYSAKTAQQAGSRLLSDVVVRQAINNIQAAVIEKAAAEAGITLERTLREIARIAYFDPRRMFDRHGNPLAITQLDDETAAVIAGLDVMEEWEGSGPSRVLIGHVKKWKLADKKGALDILMKHLGGYKNDNEQAGAAAAAAMAGLTVRFIEAKPK